MNVILKVNDLAQFARCLQIFFESSPYFYVWMPSSSPGVFTHVNLSRK